MYDIHCHLVPGVDDGSDNMGDTIEMCRIAIRGGTRGIVATPHCNVPRSYSNYWSKELFERIKAIRQELQRKGLELKVFAGQEIFLSGDVGRMLKSGELITINNSRYPLVEFDMAETSANAYRRLEQLCSCGYTPVLAHPERYGFFARHDDAEDRIKSMGCLLQINKGSLTGFYGRTPDMVARRLLKKRVVDVVASDAHGPYRRTPYMEEAYEIVCEEYGGDYADLIFEENPGRIIADSDVESAR